MTFRIPNMPDYHCHKGVLDQQVLCKKEMMYDTFFGNIHTALNVTTCIYKTVLSSKLSSGLIIISSFEHDKIVPQVHIQARGSNVRRALERAVDQSADSPIPGPTSKEKQVAIAGVLSFLDNIDNYDLKKSLRRIPESLRQQSISRQSSLDDFFDM
ncbi:hypothetical protein BDB00DRAFT_500714 [Zychaea mexicana]|uniref:uncharacterized protein n=1 Tax=Zychaea mexicana TaxID=64656 RepID=UPI0022FEC17D|nr:uncharacterized protein BDB00DRAFT_500714 [Zychaea mexicana]KAI9498147.1 hypothetical protein BDB00DRAFT_500714 [Zychaea mexicana]